LPDAPGGLTRLDRMLPALEQVSGARLRVWRVAGREGKALAGAAVAWSPPLNGREHGGPLDTPEGPAWFEPIKEADGVWLEIREPGRSAGAGGAAPDRAAALAETVGAVLAAERDVAQVAAELSERYEEIDLIYTISEILGHTIRLDEAAQRILHEVSTVVRARRATLMVHDRESGVLRLVAARGMDAKDVDPIEVDDPVSVAARVYREMRIVSYDPTDPHAVNPGRSQGRDYKGKAFLSVPVLYASPGGRPKPIGVINLTDRLGEDAFTAGDRKLVAAIANQIGATIENANLVARDLGQQRVRRELELAHDLQLKLLPSPLVLAARADVAARCRQAESVGGDFYNLLNLRDDRIGVMIGDVTSHGFGAALIMALVMAASGIHAESAATPTEVLRRIEESLAEELVRTEMFLTLFFGVIDLKAGRLSYANAGHAHAFLVSCKTGEATRLDATRPPLGVSADAGTDKAVPWRRKEQFLCLFTDGVTEALGERGDRFGESRALGHVARLKDRSARDILEAVYTDLGAFTGGAAPEDDRTLVILRV
jgi:phosphoserine phosphatase RsbU/P